MRVYRMMLAKCFLRFFRMGGMCICCLCLLASCNRPAAAGSIPYTAGDTLPLLYATGFSIVYADDYKEVTVYNPWQRHEVMERYYLIHDDTCVTPSDGLRVHIPLRRMVATSCTHIGMLDVLGCLETLAGVCSPKLIYNMQVREACANGTVVDLGDAMAVNEEKTMALNPDVVMMSGYNQSDAYSARLKRVHIPVVSNLEWMETNLLARAEWLKFVAAFYDREALADSLFTDICCRYDSLRALVVLINDKPTVMTGGNFRGTWYMPSGRGYMGRLFADAGADYFYASDTTAGSLPLGVEVVLKNFSNADVWVGSSAGTLEELAAMDSKHTLFKAFRNGRVYNFNARTTPEGGNDFWETGIVRPDWILADMIKVFYPELLSEHDFVFVRHLP